MLESPYVTQYLTEHFAEADYPTLEGYERFGGYTAARKALTEMTPDDVIEVVKTAGPAGSRGRGLPGGHEVVVHAQRRRSPQVPDLQR